MDFEDTIHEFWKALKRLLKSLTAFHSDLKVFRRALKVSKMTLKALQKGFEWYQRTLKVIKRTLKGIGGCVFSLLISYTAIKLDNRDFTALKL